MQTPLSPMALCLFVALPAQAQDFAREELPGFRETPAYVLGSAQERWSGGNVNWYYNPAGQPTNLQTQDVVNAIQTAAARWAGMCNLTFTYMGTTSAVPNVRSTSGTIDQTNVVGWGLLTAEMAGYGAYTKWWYNGSHFLIDADVVINTAYNWTLQNVESIMTHEFGHFIGLNHSNVQASVMFANPYNSYSYQRTLRGDDAEACAALYGASANAESNRAMNWAEQTFPSLLTPSPSASGTAYGYYYRYYAGTNTYVGSKDGRAYLMGSDSIIRDQGALADYAATLRSAGF